MQHLRMFEIRFFGLTHHKGARLKIIDCRFKKSVTLNYSHDTGNAADQAIAYLESLGVPVVAEASSNGATIDTLLSDNFSVQLTGSETSI